MIRRSAVLIASCLGLAAYSAVISANGPIGITSALIPNAPTDTAMYFQRFGAMALLLGIMPILVGVISRLPLSSIGFAVPRRFFNIRWILGFIALAVIVGYVGSKNPSVARFYPYHPRLPELVAERGAVFFLLHAVLYSCLYYLPWELTFRGVFVVCVTEPIDHTHVGISAGIPAAALLVAMLQIAPSTVLHIGHPVSEIFAAVVLGVVSGYMAVVSRSILPSLILHAGAGIALDLFIVLQA